MVYVGEEIVIGGHLVPLGDEQNEREKGKPERGTFPRLERALLGLQLIERA